MDWATPLPMTPRKMDSLLIVTDKFTKRAHFIPMRTTDGAAETARLFFQHVVRLHGTPTQIDSDRDPRWTSLSTKALFARLGIKQGLSTANHPQTDGSAEAMVRVIKSMIISFVNWQQDSWDQDIDVLEYCYNDSKHSSTGLTPFEVDLGFHPRSPLRPFEGSVGNEHLPTPIAMEQFVDRLKDLQFKAATALEQAQASQKKYYDAKHRDVSFQVGDKVLLSSKHVRTDSARTRKSHKLTSKRLGPFRITEAINSNAYRLELPPTIKIHPVVNVEYLTKWVESPERFEGRVEAPPPPVEIGGEKEFAVEAIEAQRAARSGKQQYLVRWKGYSEDDASWEPWEFVKDTEALRVWEESRRLEGSPSA